MTAAGGALARRGRPALEQAERGGQPLAGGRAAAGRRPLDAARASSARSARGASIERTEWLNATAPTRSSLGRVVEEVERGPPDGRHARGRTSLACIEPEMSVASTTAARSSGTATVASGRARAIATAASATRVEQQRQMAAEARAAAGATEGSSRGEAKRGRCARGGGRSAST